uniref:Uncharacterized protein n=1 Tax=Arundo donax TaxID=35708 RepID=A0A0A9DCN8_ARUDO
MSHNPRVFNNHSCTAKWKQEQGKQINHTLPLVHWLVKHNCQKFGLEPMRNPKSNNGSFVLFLYVKVVEYHICSGGRLLEPSWCGGKLNNICWR